MKKLIMEKLMVLVVTMAGFGALATDTEVNWTRGSTDESLAEGKLTLTYEEGKVKTITAAPARGDRIVVSGELMDLAENATITMANGKAECGALVFQNVLDGTGTLSFLAETNKATLLYDEPKGEGCLDKFPAWTTAFEGALLDDYEPTDVNNTGKGMANPNHMTVCNVRRYETEDGEKRLEFEAQYESLTSETYGTNLKVLKVLLRQSGANIEGCVSNAWFASFLPDTTIGRSIEFILSNKDRYANVKTFGVCTPATQSGYGIRNLKLERVAGTPLVQIENFVSNTVKSTVLALNVAAGVDVKGVGSNSFGPNKYAGTRTIDGQLTLASRTLTLNSTLTGGGVLKIVREAADDEPYVKPTKSGAVKTSGLELSAYRFLSELTNLTAVLSGTVMSTKDCSAQLCHYEISETGTNATGQVQAYSQDGTKLACMFVSFAQSTYSNVKMYPVRACWVAAEGHEIGVDFRTLSEVTDTTITTSYSGAGLQLTAVRAVWSVPSRLLVNFGAAETKYTWKDGAKVIVEGCPDGEQVAVFSATNAIPPKGEIVARNGGNVFLRKGCGSIPGSDMKDTCLWRAEKGGHIWIFYSKSDTYGTIGPNQEIELAGGQLHIGVPFGGRSLVDANGNSGQYLYNLTMSDGAVVDGPLSVNTCGAKDNSPTFTVRGSSPSYCNIDLKMTSGGSNAKKYFKWDVSDVTCDAEPDLIVNGKLGRYDSDNTHSNVVMRKYGQGTIRINHPNTEDKMVLGQTELREGTWEFGASGVSCDKAPYKMMGGAIAAAAGAVNDVGVLTVSTNGTIRVAEGGALKFADSSAATWVTAGKMAKGMYLTIDANLTNDVLRFGTDANGLTAEQLAIMRKPDGKTQVVLDENGWARDYRPGMIITVK